MAWLVLPLAIHLVEYYSASPTQNQGSMSPQLMTGMRNLMRFLHGMMNRHEGIKFVSRAVDAMILTLNTTLRRHSDGPPLIQAPLTDASAKESPHDPLNTELLSRAAMSIRRSLSYGLTTYEIV
jgi:hypothetical protein